ncbi:hypothetical protein CVT24_008807 [Panaeolus cyanescens]|uniref:Uncharacterized protein n=1 Tax=Panaeolus cyanescens TaxID=181874 RepID=A0A409WCX4_9AGAR|nr:hypothetical protein CVT24_008807 [Panaeolus cyanescens]
MQQSSMPSWSISTGIIMRTPSPSGTTTPPEFDHSSSPYEPYPPKKWISSWGSWNTKVPVNAFPTTPLCSPSTPPASVHRASRCNMWRARSLAYKLVERAYEQELALEEQQEVPAPWYGTGPYSYNFDDRFQTQLDACAEYLHGFPAEVCPRVDPIPHTPPRGTQIRYFPPPQSPIYDWFWTPPTSPALQTSASPTSTNIPELPSEILISNALASPDASTDESTSLGPPRALAFISSATGDEIDNETKDDGMEIGVEGRQHVGAPHSGQSGMGGGSNSEGDDEEEDGDDGDIIPAVRVRGIKRKRRITLPLWPPSPYRTPSPEIDEEYWRAAAPAPRRPHNQGEDEQVVEQLGLGVYLRDFYSWD